MSTAGSVPDFSACTTGQKLWTTASMFITAFCARPTLSTYPRLTCTQVGRPISATSEHSDAPVPTAWTRIHNTVVDTTGCFWFSKQCPRGTYLIEVKGKQKGTTVDSRHMYFHEGQVLPKFKDATAKSLVRTDVDSLLDDFSPAKQSRRTKAPSGPDEDSAKKPQLKPKKSLTQELVDEDRVLVQGPKFIPKTGTGQSISLIGFKYYWD